MLRLLPASDFVARNHLTSPTSCFSNLRAMRTRSLPWAAFWTVLLTLRWSGYGTLRRAGIGPCLGGRIRYKRRIPCAAAPIDSCIPFHNHTSTKTHHHALLRLCNPALRHAPPGHRGYYWLTIRPCRTLSTTGQEHRWMLRAPVLRYAKH
ncbi:hypothetical protein BCV69DRAFT_204491 [Microstroma glucosiphilum]|uniref:Uncharacterized protein n=1 Tax=Pseudomicrostroma glucosiphilum TaxID=1684307 RepID=A0A316UB72_9BASI|nr:hypothetical protein BCV69DRAFT_204491 [Pseudomicrostroma glucosiphilum]PWN20265.1 hypothetical protein BCV69DRAFT_204491 [Pseudomicrostroma glucosiphilum]